MSESLAKVRRKAGSLQGTSCTTMPGGGVIGDGDGRDGRGRNLYLVTCGVSSSIVVIGRGSLAAEGTSSSIVAGGLDSGARLFGQAGSRLDSMFPLTIV